MITEHADADLNQNKEVVLRFMRLMDGAPSDLDALDEVLAPDLRLQLGASHLDRTQTKDFIRAVYAAFPDYTHTPEDILAVGDRVVLRQRIARPTAVISRALLRPGVASHSGRSRSIE